MPQKPEVASEGTYEFSAPSTASETKKGCLIMTLVGVAIAVIIGVLVYVFYPECDEEEARENCSLQPRKKAVDSPNTS